MNISIGCLRPIFFLILVNVTMLSSAAPAKKIISTASELKSAVASLNPGDTLEVINGTYDLNTYLSLTRSGTKDLPIVIRAASAGGAVFVNKSAFTFKSVSYVTLEGFVFNSKDVTAVKLESCNHVRITRNIFRLQESASLKWLVVGGTSGQVSANSFENRIDHNLFEEKHQLGNFITIDGSADPEFKSSVHDRIDHNHFRNNSPRAVNGQESVRVGWSRMSMSPGYTVIEHNLFENCDGDPEIVSVKTCEDSIRYNTFLNSMGTLCLRHGNGSVVEGNFFLGNGKPGTGGIRVYGDDHKVFNNYMEGLTGNKSDAAIAVTNGDADYPASDLTKHYRPRRGIYVFNTLVNNAYNIEVGYTSGGSYTKPPLDNVFANNLISGSVNLLIQYYTTPLNQTVVSNVLHLSGSAQAGISYDTDQIKTMDPRLIRQGGISRLSASSPLIDAAKGTYPFAIFDMDGQQRNNPADIGADEYSAEGAVSLRPLSGADVGPFAGLLTDVADSDKNTLPAAVSLYQNYPNPFNSTTRISFQLHSAGFIKLKIFDIKGKEIAALIDKEMPAGMHSVSYNAEGLKSGIYFCNLITETSNEIKKIVLLK